MDGHDVRFAQTPKQAIAQMMVHPATVVMIDQDIVGVTTGELLPALRLLAPYRDNLFRIMFWHLLEVPNPSNIIELASSTSCASRLIMKKWNVL